MRINRHIAAAQANQAETRRARGTDPLATAKPDESASSVVSINKNAAAAATSASGPISDQISARLDEVRQQLADGTYKVDYDRLAENILKSELDSDS